MNDQRKDHDDIDRRILVDAVDEAKAIGREGMHHPSAKPVLTGAALGAVAGLIVPVGPVIGALAGAGIMLYKRVRP